MMRPTTQNAAKLVADGFYLFAEKPTNLLTLHLPRLTVLRQPLTEEGLEIFRAVRISDGKIRHDKSNISYDLAPHDGGYAIVLNDLYLTKDFGIAIALDLDFAKFEFSPAFEKTAFSQLFQFKTLEGHAFEPQCYYKTL